MLQHLKRLGKHSIVYGVGHILSRFIGFLLMPIHTNVFLPEVYRTPTLLFSALAIFNIIFTYGMDTAFIRFFILEDLKEAKHRIFSTVFFTILSTGLFFSLMLLFFPLPFSNLIFKNDAYTGLIRLASGILLADALSLIPFLVLRAEERSARFVVVRTANIVLNVGLNILFIVVLKKGIDYIFVSNLIASGATLLMLMPVTAQWLRLTFNKSTLGELLRFGLPYIPSVLSVIIMDKIGNFFLDRMVGEKMTGIFSAGCKLGMFMALVVAAFRFAWHPFFLSISKQKDAPEIFARVMTYFLLVTGFFFLLISFFINEIVHIRFSNVGLVGATYVEGVSIVPVIMLAYIFYGVFTNFIVGIYIKNKSMYIPFVTGMGGITSLLANYFLIPHFGIMGAAWAVALSYAVMAISLYFVNNHLYPIPYEMDRIVKLVGIIVGLFLVYTFLLNEAKILIKVLLLLSALPLLFAVRFFNNQELNRMRHLIVHH